VVWCAQEQHATNDAQWRRQLSLSVSTCVDTEGGHFEYT